MSNKVEKISSFASRSCKFLVEQTGGPENEFKEAVVEMLRSRKSALRAYLAQVEHTGAIDRSVALCVASESGEDDELVDGFSSIFSNMFGRHEHLDILFLSKEKEIRLRKICCPFFSSKRFDVPDFYLTSSEGYGLEEIRACYKERRLTNGHPDGYVLCEIDPPIVGQPYELGNQNIDKIVIASRHSGYSIFSISEWPAYVHVARLVRSCPDKKFTITESDIESIGWGELYQSSASAKGSFVPR